MDHLGLRRGRQHFDTATRPRSVTFDDGRHRKRNFPWGHYVEAHWDYEEPETIYITIGEWLVVIYGHNIGPLYTAIEDHTLTRIRACPEYEGKEGHADDTFATEIRFVKAPQPGKNGQSQFELGA